MADVAWTDVVNVAATQQQATTLGAILLPAQMSILAFVNDAFDPGYFDGEDGVVYARARALLAAHFAILQSTSTAPAGAVTGETAFGLQRSYATVPTPTWMTHAETSFGRAFDDLVRSQPNRGGFAT